jgi:hypothetical protein
MQKFRRQSQTENDWHWVNPAYFRMIMRANRRLRMLLNFSTIDAKKSGMQACKEEGTRLNNQSEAAYIKITVFGIASGADDKRYGEAWVIGQNYD